MKEIDDINDRLDSNDEIIDSLVKKATELEKQVTKTAELNIPDYSAALDTIVRQLSELKQSKNNDQQLALLAAINTRLDKMQRPGTRQIRVLLFPETNQGQYYKIVFGRLIPWGLCFMVATYIFITGYKAIGVYRYNQDVRQSVHYERAWLYLRQHARKKVVNAMDEAYDKTKDN